MNLLDCDIEIFYIGNIEMIIVHDGFATIDPATLVQQDKLSEMVANWSVLWGNGITAKLVASHHIIEP